MAKIDTSEWKPFVIGDLFEKLQLDIKNENFNKTLDVSEERSDEFNLPLVNAKHGNNGIMYYGREADFEAAEMTIDIVQNGAIATGDVYAQPQKTGVLWDAYLVKPKAEIDSAFTLMFLATVLENAIKDKFSYDDKCVWDEAKLLSVRLPCTGDGEPDWAYMDAYMSEVMRDCEMNLAELHEGDSEKRTVDTSDWKEFHIGGESGLFDVVKGSRLTKAAMREGTINFISASSFNNGIAAHIANDEKIHPGNTMTVSYNGSDIGRTFYQKEPFWASDDVNVLYPRFKLNERIALFLAPLIKEAGGSHIYKNKWLQTDMMNTSIPLPVTDEGTPDWAYMDEYMRTVMAGAEADLAAMQSIV